MAINHALIQPSSIAPQPYFPSQSFYHSSNMISLPRVFVPVPVKIKAAPASIKGRFSIATSCSSSRTSFMQQKTKIRFTRPAQEAEDYVLGVDKRQGRCFYNLEGNNFSSSDQSSSKLERNPRIVGSSHGWLAVLEPSNCSLSLKKPSTATSTGVNLRLPPIETLPVFTGKVYHETDMDKPGFHGHGVAGFTYRGSDGEERFETSENLSEYFVDKLMLTSDPTSEDCAVVMTTHNAKSKMACCRPGDLTWRTLNTGCGSGDVVYNPIDNKFYAIRNKSTLQIEVWDFKDPDHPEKTIVNPLPAPSSLKVDSQPGTRSGNCYIKGYLVCSLGNIFLVARHYAYDPNGELPYKTFWFDVMKLDNTGRKIEVVDSLGDQAFFLGISHCFAISASIFVGGAEPNSIYFGDPYGLNQTDSTEGQHDQDFGVFNVEDSSIKTCHPAESMKFSVRASASGPLL